MNAKSRPRRVILSIVSAAALVACHPPWSIGVLAPIALVPLLVALRGLAGGRRIALGWLCGSLWSFAMVGGAWLWRAAASSLDADWLISGLVALGASQLYGALHVALFAFLIGRQRERGMRAALRVAAAWVASEALRSATFGGIPWGLLGHALWQLDAFVQLASLAGVAAVSFWLALVNALVAGAVSAPRQTRDLVPNLARALAVVVAVGGYGFWRLGQASAGSPVAVQVVYSDWHRLGAQDGALLVERLERETRANAGAEVFTLWPEASLRTDPTERPELANRLYRLARELDRDLLFGGLRQQAGARFNSVYHLAPRRADFVSSYDKRRLVPLAEGRWSGLPAGAIDFEAGAEATFTVGRGGLKVGVLLCFEALFPDLAVRQKVDLLVNPSNDVRLGIGAEQQAAMAVFRAVETGTSVVRVSNRGPSMLIDPHGRILATARGWGSEVWEVPPPLPATVFQRIAGIWVRFLPIRAAGDGLLSWACLIWVTFRLSSLLRSKVRA